MTTYFRRSSERFPVYSGIHSVEIVSLLHVFFFSMTLEPTGFEPATSGLQSRRSPG